MWVPYSAHWSNSWLGQADFFPPGTCWCVCHWGQLEEWCSCSSLSWEQGGLEGLLKGVQECTSLGVGTLLCRLWLCYCCLPLLYEHLYLGQECLIDKLSCGPLMLVSSEQAGGRNTPVDTLKGWSGWPHSCLNGERMGVCPLALGGVWRCFWLCMALLDGAWLGCTVLQWGCSAFSPVDLWWWQLSLRWWGSPWRAQKCALPLDWDLPEQEALQRLALTSNQSSSSCNSCIKRS